MTGLNKIIIIVSTLRKIANLIVGYPLRRDSLKGYQLNAGHGRDLTVRPEPVEG